MNPVRRITSILTLALLASCASGTQQRSFFIEVLEQRPRMRAQTVNGMHLFIMRITNRSEETIVVDSVELRPQTTSLQFYENDDAVDDTLQPGETREIQMTISVNSTALNYITTIDSVDASVTAHSASQGRFTETQGCTVIVSQ